MIMPGDVPLTDDKVRANVLVPLPAGYEAVLAKEVAGDHCKPAQIEARSPSIGKNRAVTRAASALFMATAPFGSTNKGSKSRAFAWPALFPASSRRNFPKRCGGSAKTPPISTTRATTTGSRRSRLSTRRPKIGRAPYRRTEVEAEIVALIRGEEQPQGDGLSARARGARRSARHRRRL